MSSFYINTKKTGQLSFINRPLCSRFHLSGWSTRQSCCTMSHMHTHIVKSHCSGVSLHMILPQCPILQCISLLRKWEFRCNWRGAYSTCSTLDLYSIYNGTSLWRILKIRQLKWKRAQLFWRLALVRYDYLYDFVPGCFC